MTQTFSEKFQALLHCIQVRRAFFLCLSAVLFCTLSACTVRPVSAPLPQIETGKSGKFLPCTIRFTQGKTELLLMGALEFSVANKDTAQPAQLGLALIQGKRFAHCSYDGAHVLCTLTPQLQSRQTQYIAEISAQCVAALLRFYAHPKAENIWQELPRAWGYAGAEKTRHRFTNSLQNATLSIDILEETAWQ